MADQPGGSSPLPLRHQIAKERMHDDFKASNETGRAAAQAAILINGGAATAILAFVSKVTTPPDQMRAACVALVLYALGVFFGVLAMWYSAQAAGQFGSAERGVLENDSGAANDRRKAEQHLERHRWYFFISPILFLAASIWLAIKLS